MRKPANHLRIFHRPEPVIFISTRCNGDSRKLIQTNASIAFSKPLGTPWLNSFSSIMTSSISTPSNISNAIRRDNCQIRFWWTIESVPVLKSNNRITGARQSVVLRMFGPMNFALSRLSSIGSQPPNMIPTKGYKTNDIAHPNCK